MGPKDADAPLTAEQMRELLLQWEDGLRALLSHKSDGYSGTSRVVKIDLGPVQVTKGQVQAFLKRKAAQRDQWQLVSFVVSVVAAVAAIVAAVASVIPLLK